MNLLSITSAYGISWPNCQLCLCTSHSLCKSGFIQYDARMPIWKISNENRNHSCRFKCILPPFVMYFIQFEFISKIVFIVEYNEIFARNFVHLDLNIEENKFDKKTSMQMHFKQNKPQAFDFLWKNYQSKEMWKSCVCITK